MILLNKTWTILSLVGILLLILFFSGCAFGNAGSNDTAQEETYRENIIMELTFATLPALETFPIFIADNKGFFEDEGLTVVLEQFFNPRDRDIAFQTNTQIDGMVFDLVQLAIFREAGIDIVATTSTIGLASLVGVQGAYTIEDLYDGDVLMTSNTSMDYILDRALTSVGMTIDNIVINEVPALPTRLEMLLHGHAVGAILPDPFATMALKEGFNLITTTKELGINPFIFAFRREVVEQNPEAMEAFYRAINRAVDFLNTASREEFIDILVGTVGYPAHVRDTLIVPYFPPHAVPTDDVVRDVIDFVYSRGLITVNMSTEDIVFDIGVSR